MYFTFTMYLFFWYYYSCEGLTMIILPLLLLRQYVHVKWNAYLQGDEKWSYKAICEFH